jgi:hypothetical protein
MIPIYNKKDKNEQTKKKQPFLKLLTDDKYYTTLAVVDENGRNQVDILRITDLPDLHNFSICRVIDIEGDLKENGYDTSMFVFDEDGGLKSS